MKFRTRYEYFEYQIILFELIKALITFQTYINEMLKEFVNVICIIYLNDILTFKENSTKHQRHIY